MISSVKLKKRGKILITCIVLMMIALVNVVKASAYQAVFSYKDGDTTLVEYYNSPDTQKDMKLDKWGDQSVIIKYFAQDKANATAIQKAKITEYNKRLGELAEANLAGTYTKSLSDAWKDSKQYAEENAKAELPSNNDGQISRPSDTTEEILENNNTNNTTQDDDSFLGGILSGIGSIFMWIVRLVPVTIADGVGKIISSIGALITGAPLSQGLTLDQILFNKIEITSIEFFNISSDQNVNDLRTNIGIWYVAIRNLAAIALAVVLLYVGIRMAISSVAEDRAKYKKMLGDWAVSLALLFVLHYIMVAVITINNSLVDIMSNWNSQRFATTGQNVTNLMNQFAKAAYSLDVDIVQGIAFALLYLLLSVMTFIFLLTYIKRMITIAFLIIIAPLITITYSIDKMGDGKSQALNAWMKEFIYNILIQPFHCIIYLSLVTTAFNMINTTGTGNFIEEAANNLGASVIALMMIIFMYQAEDIIKNIFNFQSSSMPKTLAQGAVFATALGAIGSAKKGASALKSSGGGKTPKYKGSGANANNKKTNTKPTQTNRQSQNTNNMNNANARQNAKQNAKQNGFMSAVKKTNLGKGIAKASNKVGQKFKSTAVGGKLSNLAQTASKKLAGGANSVAGRTIKKAVGSYLKGSIKATGYAMGLMAGLATGELSAGIAGAKSIGGATSELVKSQGIKMKQRKLAKAYNNMVYNNPAFNNLDSKSKVSYSRQLLDQEIAPKNDIEREYLEAMQDLKSEYENIGLDDPSDKIEKTIEQVDNGQISELSARERFSIKAGNGVTKASDKMKEWKAKREARK